MQTISACLIVKNEEAVLARCLESVTSWVDEIIVVDTGSTDKTIEIAKKFTDKVYHFDWIDDFSAARNFSLEKASGDWLFWLDADDEIPQETGQRLRMLIAVAEEKTGFFAFWYVNNNPTLLLPLSRFALFRNHPAIRFTGRIHEQIFNPENLYPGSPSTVVKTELKINHNSLAADDPALQQSKLRFYHTIMVKENLENPDHPPLVYHLGISSLVLNEVDNGIALLKRYLELDTKGDIYRRGNVYAALISICIEQSKFEEASYFWQQAYQEMPRHSDILFYGGTYLLRIGDRAGAYKIFQELVKLDYAFVPELINPLILNLHRYIRLAELYIEDGKGPEAEALCFQALQNNKGNKEVMLLLGKAYQIQEDETKLQEYLKQVKLVNPELAKDLRKQFKK